MKIILIVIIAISIFYIAILEKEIKSISRQLKKINDDSLKNTKVKSHMSSKKTKELIMEINKTIMINQEKDLNYQNKDREIKETIASISHDLKTPLTSIKGYADLLSEREEGKNKEYIDIIKNRVDALDNLIKSFYELSRLELKEYEYSLEYIKIDELILESVAAFYENFLEEDISPDINLLNKNIKIIGDKKSFERIFINLTSNALKYSDKVFKISSYEDNENYIIDFTNDTIGMSEEDIKKIFNRFYTVDTSRQSESTGLGLFITRELLKDMGHSIKAELNGNNISIKLYLKKG